MASRVLLVSINQCDDPYPVFPLGLGHIDTALRRAGHKTEWIDLRVNAGSLRAVVETFKPDFVGISVRNIDDVIIRKRETFFGPLTSLCPELRQWTRAPIILGGSGFSIFPRELLRLAGADFGIYGDGESAIVALIAALESGGDYGDVPGVVHWQDGEIVVNERAKPLSTFNGAVRPAPIADHYLHRSSMLNLQTQRGCSHRCCYCTYPLIEGNTWRRRDPEEVAAEMAELEAAGAKYVFIVDSVFNSSRAHVEAVCAAFLRRGIRVPWGCFLRPQGLTAELMNLMRRAGLKHIEFGSDSFCDSVLREYDKRLIFDDILHSSELARNEQVEFCHFLVCGGPGETRETLLETFANSQRLQGAVILALVGARVYPRTPLFKRALAERVFDADTDFLAPQYYLSPSIAEEAVFELLHEFSRKSPMWVVGDPSPAYLKMAERLRAKGVVGPLWTYVAAMQRLGLMFVQKSAEAATPT